jgi:hypothetical protein
MSVFGGIAEVLEHHPEALRQVARRSGAAALGYEGDKVTPNGADKLLLFHLVQRKVAETNPVVGGRDLLIRSGGTVRGSTRELAPDSRRA